MGNELQEHLELGGNALLSGKGEESAFQCSSLSVLLKWNSVDVIPPLDRYLAVIIIYPYSSQPVIETATAYEWFGEIKFNCHGKVTHWFLLPEVEYEENKGMVEHVSRVDGRRN